MYPPRRGGYYPPAERECTIPFMGYDTRFSASTGSSNPPRRGGYYPPAERKCAIPFAAYNAPTVNAENVIHDQRLRADAIRPYA